MAFQPPYPPGSQIPQVFARMRNPAILAPMSKTTRATLALSQAGVDFTVHA